MNAAADLALGQKREPALDLIEPGGVGGSEVEVIARPFGTRNAKAWAVVRRLAKLRSVSSSASLKVKTDKGRPMIQLLR
jgi:hypothetical protein